MTDHPSGHADDEDPPSGEQRSLWLDTSERTAYDPLEDGLRVDTAVVGGGIVGLTAAHHLDRAGQSVAVLERDHVLEGVTGHTTAKLTSLHGLVYDHLLEQFGQDAARQYATANEAAIDEVEATVDEYDIDCGFERTPAYTYAQSRSETGKLRDEVSAARRIGLPATYVESTPLPYDVAGAVRFDDQARFHPRNYLLELARRTDGDGSHVFEQTRVSGVDAGDPCRVTTDRGQVVADDVVVGTNFPIEDHAFYFARLSPKRSYVLALRLAGSPPEGLYYDPSEPYFSVRPLADDDPADVLVGGQNHRTGHGGSTADRYRALERRAREKFDVESVAYRWATQDYVSVDRVPFVGRQSPRTDHCYVATGFGGWGMTNGTAAGRILADRITGQADEWAAVFQPTRFKARASAGSLLEHNRHAATHFLRDHLENPPAAPVRDVPRGEGTVVEVDGEPVGVYHDEADAYHVVSAVCPHMGCHVEWNDGERSWDCPCHGSRFDADGHVLHTPATQDLERPGVLEATDTPLEQEPQD